MSHFSSVDTSPEPSALIDSLDRTAVGLGAMKRYVAYRLALLTDEGWVLDIGCGAGHDLALLTHEGCEPVGVDASAVMLTETRRRCSAPLVRSVGERLPFRASTFDGCRIERVLMHADDPRRVLEEVRRVLRPGGFIAVFEPDWTSLRLDTVLGAARSIPAALSRCQWPDIGGALADLVEEVGFEIVDEVTEASRCGALQRVPLDVDALLQRAVDERRIDRGLAVAWLAEQRARDAAGTFRARWKKHLIVAWAPPSSPSRAPAR